MNPKKRVCVCARVNCPYTPRISLFLNWCAFCVYTFSHKEHELCFVHIKMYSIEFRFFFICLCVKKNYQFPRIFPPRKLPRKTPRMFPRWFRLYGELLRIIGGGPAPRKVFIGDWAKNGADGARGLFIMNGLGLPNNGGRSMSREFCP